MNNENTEKEKFSRREFLKLMFAGGAALGAGVILKNAGNASPEDPHMSHSPLMQAMDHDEHNQNMTVGDVNLNDFDPSLYLEKFDWGKETVLPDGRMLREWEVDAYDKDVEIAPGVFFPAWTYNGQVPGPTFRCNEGDLLRFHFTNSGSHAHTIHFHGIHPPSMDGVTPLIEPGGEFVYEFEAKPFGLHLYHCHVPPIKRHIHKGLYGTFIIDPPGGRAPAHEMVMMMNAFDTNFDGENEVYAVNTVAFHYAKHPIQVKIGELVRIYLVNITEFDLLNSFHMHASMYRLYRTGTNLDHYEYTDMVIMGQGERHILEFNLESPGMYMFHAHQSEFAELGWMGFFEAVE